LLDRKKALLHAHLADPATGVAGFWLGPGAAAATRARFAIDQGWYPDFDFGPAYGIFE
jgi:hypothetical protein